MSVFIFTKKESALKTVFAKNAQFSSSAEISGHSPSDGDISYIDISGLTEAEIKKLLPQFKKICRNTSWGVIDPKGSIKDSSQLFFEGASDYLGASFFKDASGIDPKRIKEALGWRKAYVKSITSGAANDDASSEAGSTLIKAGSKLPAESLFPGWKKMQSGKVMPFYLLYGSLQGKIPFDARLTDKIIAQVHKRFLEYMEDSLYDCSGLLWMNTGKDCLFLIPPKVKCIEAAIKSCFNMIVSAPQIVLETFEITIPSNFIFALHYGSVTYKPPGRTGTIVSDAVNYIFHLGAKKSEPGRLTVSGELPEKTIPQALQDSFVFAGEFEGRKIWQTKKFTYVKPWV